jgi:DNA-binding NarL/FixJ family response regulator
VVLAIPHFGLNEGIRCLLATLFDSVVMVADEGSLCGCAESMRPNLAVVDLEIGSAGGTRLIERLHALLPETKVLVIGADDPAVARAALRAGADGYLRLSALGSELVPEVERLLGWEAPA